MATNTASNDFATESKVSREDITAVPPGSTVSQQSTMQGSTTATPKEEPEFVPRPMFHAVSSILIRREGIVAHFLQRSWHAERLPRQFRALAFVEDAL